MSHLFDPLDIRGTRLRNRIFTAPMCQYSVMTRDGVPTPWHLMHLGSIAAGGSSLVIAEATAVTPGGRISDRDTGIWNDDQVDAWRPIARFIAEQGAVPGIQLAHAGRKASTWSPWGEDGRSGSIPADSGGWTALAPSPIAFHGLAVPEELDLEGIDRVVDAFTAAARRSVKAGFGMVEIHAAHGYLLHEFLSPASNVRVDAYGGSLENRARLLLRVVASVREAIGDLPLFVRFSASEWVPTGWDVDECATVAQWCADAGADFFDISSGGNVPADIPVGPGYQVPFAARIRELTGLPVSAVGIITEPAQAAEVVASGQADAVSLARELLRDPHFPLRAAHELGVEVDYWPGQYLRATWRTPPVP
ncbi:NADH:flavin oxidoreductase/NADH oxidase [Humibacter ginsenosidimutans]|uniref:NADH:flavin oxidoreductase/NADH oxidase n=1 Tax=Humibacter ginsenosidimutans TaxID=2599293 RepID=A0A5B8M9Z7_9MICO|nr:NADH:flavin oxidoreductase/NADH oxidase [Humibacter ginsenosidimutans]QDZ16492.1 NADH:flavin oxidoreductase/NADH oxidase [Humibacter ginsenosidimutans]